MTQNNLHSTKGQKQNTKNTEIELLTRRPPYQRRRSKYLIESMVFSKKTPSQYPTTNPSYETQTKTHLYHHILNTSKK